MFNIWIIELMFVLGPNAHANAIVHDDPVRNACNIERKLTYLNGDGNPGENPALKERFSDPINLQKSKKNSK